MNELFIKQIEGISLEGLMALHRVFMLAYDHAVHCPCCCRTPADLMKIAEKLQAIESQMNRHISTDHLLRVHELQHRNDTKWLQHLIHKIKHWFVKTTK